ncbi:glycosyltransferase [Staphylococcus agnetis]|uniref:glycosyltransferase family 2 protein n=1 Tax=Staphylococcus agnetis TaxID=985762 RepID=UPI00142FF301|nr:glycosyltransferase [Staphylococcus agnetis]NJH86284.1 glycosyltransferase [Staphylococcus agnetis]NJI15972.1 glycosyltransferase [Staphylococcus agnetis]
MTTNISIIITYYNQPESIDIVMKSLENQVNVNKSNIEVVIVDDGSKYKKRLQINHSELKIKYVELDKNRGRSKARNSGANVSEGSLLIFIDGDRFASPNFINSHIQSHKNSNEKIVIGDIIEVFSSDIGLYKTSISNMFEDKKDIIWKYTRRYNYADIVFNIFDSQGHSFTSYSWISMFSGNFSIPKELFKKLEGFDSNFLNWGMENIEFGYRAYKNNVAIEFNPKAVNFHIYHKANRKNSTNLHTFLNKYNNDNKINKYLKFVNSEISLYDLDPQKLSPNLKKIYYDNNKLGPRYDFTTFLRSC